jgi:hypothetical protein
MPKTKKRKRKFHGLPLEANEASPLGEFLAEIEPELVLEAIREFQLNWCDHDDQELIVSNPNRQVCLSCGLIWPEGQQPPKGDL